MSSLRQSESCWVEDGASQLVDSLAVRMNLITGLQTSALLDKEAKKEEYEYLQLGSYGSGGYYKVHQDPLFVYKDHHFIAQSVEAVGGDQYSTGTVQYSTVQYSTGGEGGSEVR